MPMTPDDICSNLLVNTLIKQNTTWELSKHIPLYANGKPRKTNWRFMLLNVFAALGGKSTEPSTILWEEEIYKPHLQEAKKQAKELGYENLKIIPFNSKYANNAQKNMKRVGINFLRAREFFNQQLKNR